MIKNIEDRKRLIIFDTVLVDRHWFSRTCEQHRAHRGIPTVLYYANLLLFPFDPRPAASTRRSIPRIQYIMPSFSSYTENRCILPTYLNRVTLSFPCPLFLRQHFSRTHTHTHTHTDTNEHRLWSTPPSHQLLFILNQESIAILSRYSSYPRIVDTYYLVRFNHRHRGK